MRIGYACKTVGVPGTQLKSCTLKNATHQNLTAIIGHNLQALHSMLIYNHQNGIKMFRLSSDIIPFATSAAATLNWEELFAQELEQLQNFIAQSDIRISMHPGQYTVINSPIKDVVTRAKEDLDYHARLLDALTPLASSKIILHVGGVYGDKKAALERFIQNYRTLPLKVTRRLVIENDERCYTAEEVLDLCKTLNAPAVFDNLHNLINPSANPLDEALWIKQFAATWGKNDGRQKIHYSQQAVDKRPGSHSPTIYFRPFLAFCEALQGQDVDIMLEVKDKNLSAVKCINCTQNATNTLVLEKEWAHYKYFILEHAPQQYHAIRTNFREKEQPIAFLFYQKTEVALDAPINTGNSANALNHVWGYFKDIATPAEKAQWSKRITGYLNGSNSLNTTKKWLLRMAQKYQQDYLLQSLYFYIE
ncbi:MAG: UV DNA damage repair endonuclease UvsE [Oscillospiraceae bacterium]